MNRIFNINKCDYDDLVKNGHQKTIYAVVEFLQNRGRKFKVYKDIMRPSYILEIKNDKGETLTLKYKNGVDLLNDLKDVFFNEREKQENEIMRERVKRWGLLEWMTNKVLQPVF